MGSVVVPKDKNSVRILVMVSVHEPGFRLADVHELSEVKLRGILKSKHAADKAPE